MIRIKSFVIERAVYFFYFFSPSDFKSGLSQEVYLTLFSRVLSRDLV